MTISDELVIYIPLAGVIDIEAEKSRLQKRLEKVISDMVNTQKHLDNPKFVQRAPESVVAQKADLLNRLKSEKEKLDTNLEMLQWKRLSETPETMRRIWSFCPVDWKGMIQNS